MQKNMEAVGSSGANASFQGMNDTFVAKDDIAKISPPSSDPTAVGLADANQTLFALGLSGVDVASIGIILSGRADFTQLWWIPTLCLLVSLGFAMVSAAPNRTVQMPLSQLGQAALLTVAIAGLVAGGSLLILVRAAMRVLGWNKAELELELRSVAWKFSLGLMLLSFLCASVLVAIEELGICRYATCN